MSSDGSFGDYGCEFDGFVDADVPADVCELFTHPRRAAVWSVLREADGSLSTSALAARLVARHRDADDAEDRRRTAIDLHHVQLPKLAAFEFVDWDREADRVALATRPPISHDRIETLFEGEKRDQSRADRYDPILADDRRREVLSVLAEEALVGDGGDDGADEPAVPVDRLATRVAAASSTTADRVHLSLHHVHLPAMADRGLLEYDADERTVAITADGLEAAQ